MSFSNDTSLIASLNNASFQLFRYGGIFLFTFGTIGNCLNFLVLWQPGLRSNPCAMFFRFSSVFNLIFTVLSLSNRMLSGWISDPANTSVWFCKLRSFVLYTSRTVALWLIMFATVDRWFSSNPNVRYRRISTTRNAHRSLILIVLFSVLLYAHVLYCNELNMSKTPIKCFGHTVLCRSITDYCDICITVVAPITLMIIFGAMIISNVRRSQRRLRALPLSIMATNINNTTTQPLEQKHKTTKLNRHLISMLLFQVTILALFSLPFSIVKIYSTVTSSIARSPLRISTDNFVFNFTLLLVYVSTGAPFYIYTLCGGSIFRNALFDVVKSVRTKLRI